MLLKRIAIVTVAATIGFLSAACSDDSEDACKHINDVCKLKLDCSKANDDYDKLSDADKEKQDKAIDCVMDADTCDAIQKCGVGGSSSSSSTSGN
jgi:hypothetical protein